MRYTRRGTLLAGLAATLGLFSIGCRSSTSLGRPNFSGGPPGGFITSRGHAPPGRSVRILKPRARYESSGQVRPAGASLQTPVAQSAGLPDGGVVVASNWRGLSRRGEPSPYPIDRVPVPPGDEGRIAPVPVNAPSETREPEKLPAPHAAHMVHHGDAVAMHHGPGGVGPLGAPVPREGNKVTLPEYVIEPPDILLIQWLRKEEGIQPIEGQHLVRPDGTVSLGIYGSVRVAGLTLSQARDAVAQALLARGITEADELDAEKEKTGKKVPLRNEINVDVLAYNSKVYYVITDGGGYGEAVYRLPITGNETVLDAIGLVNGLPSVASKKRIWVARANPAYKGGSPVVLWVDWLGIAQRGEIATNYQVLPGDRIYVNSDPHIRVDSRLAKFLAPIERVLGVTLLGSSVVNSIQGRGAFGGGGFR